MLVVKNVRFFYTQFNALNFFRSGQIRAGRVVIFRDGRAKSGNLQNFQYYIMFYIYWIFDILHCSLRYTRNSRDNRDSWMISSAQLNDLLKKRCR